MMPTWIEDEACVDDDLKTARQGIANQLSQIGNPTVQAAIRHRQAMAEREEVHRILLDMREPRGETFPTGTEFTFQGMRYTLLHFIPDNGWDGNLYAVLDEHGEEGLAAEITVEIAIAAPEIASLLVVRNASLMGTEKEEPATEARSGYRP